MKMTAAFALAVSLCAAALGSGPSFARDNDDDHDRARDALQRGEVLPIVRILPMAAKQLPGDVVEVKLDEKRGRLCYQLKILTPSGRVRELVLDARTGAVVERDD